MQVIKAPMRIKMPLNAHRLVYPGTPAMECALQSIPIKRSPPGKGEETQAVACRREK